jgi:hypothetical protein
MPCHWHRMYRACSVKDTAWTMLAVSMTPHAACILYQLHLCTVHLASMTPHARCMHAPHAYRKFRFSSRIQICMQKGFSPLIRGPGQMFKWKKRWSKISWHFPFKQIKLYSRINSVKLIFLRYSLLDMIEHTNNIRISDNIMLSDNM